MIREMAKILTISEMIDGRKALFIHPVIHGKYYEDDARP
jgi:hypothetical protein